MRCGSGGVPGGSLEGGKVVDPPAVGQALKQLLARTEIVETRALVAASDAVATFRILYLPVEFREAEVSAAVAKELELDPERFSTRWVELSATNQHRVVYAVAWDRALVHSLTEAVRAAGLEPTAVDLKSAALARAVTEPSCVVVDLSSEPVDIVLVDGFMPQVWLSFESRGTLGSDLAPALASPLRSVLRFYRRRRGDVFPRSAPILVGGEQLLPSESLAQLSSMVGQPVAPLAMPSRVAQNVRHGTFLACLGLMMRRT